MPQKQKKQKQQIPLISVGFENSTPEIFTHPEIVAHIAKQCASTTDFFNMRKTCKFFRDSLEYDFRKKLTDKYTILQAACGEFHSMCVTKSGHVFAFGCNNTGQLGINSLDRSRKTPTRVL